MNNNGQPVPQNEMRALLASQQTVRIVLSAEVPALRCMHANQSVSQGWHAAYMHASVR